MILLSLLLTIFIWSRDMKFLVLSFVFILFFVAMSVVVTASGLGVIDLWLEANTDLSPFKVAA